MGWNLMGSREQFLTNKVNKIEFQLTNLEEAKNSMSNKMGNYQRLMNQEDQKQSIWDYFLLHQYTSGSGNIYNSPELKNDWENYFWPYAQLQMVESDIDMQIKQLETQLQVARQELKNAQEAKKTDIENGTPKYA